MSYIYLFMYGLFMTLIFIKEPWDQEKFERLLTEWIIACDQPFDEVEKPEFRTLLTYVHRQSPDLTIPGRNGVKRRVIKMGKASIEATKKMLSVCYHCAPQSMDLC